MKSIPPYVHNHQQMLFNVMLFFVIGQYIVREIQVATVFIKPALIDITFFIHNVIFLAVILVRREYIQLDRNWFHWLISIFSFFSGLFFLKSSSSTGTIIEVADAITIAAIVVGMAALLSLGRSFGIVPAVRKVRTGGLYHIVRHPMFVSDILFKIPLVLKYFTLYNSAIFILSLLLYILRAQYEEELLLHTQEYQHYKNRVKYRFIPYIY